MKTIKQSDPRAALRRVYFECVDATSVLTPLQASDMNATWTIYLSKNGGTPVASAIVPSQIDATNQKGDFYLELAKADCDTVGSLLLTIANTGGSKSMVRRSIEVKIEQAFLATVVSATSTSITCDRAESASGFWKSYVSVLTGAGAGQVRKLGGSSTGALNLDAGVTFAVVPAASDVVEILAR